MIPKVSIIVPIYNVEEYLEECLDSIVNQTLKDIEIICINDGSTDNSFDIIKKYQKNDQRIKLVNQENSGLSKSRNNGVKIATGEYVLFVDSDDWINLETAKELYEIAKKDELDLLIFQIINYDDDQKKFFETNYYKNLWFPKSFDNKIFSNEDVSEYIFSLSCTAVSKLYKRELINEFNIEFPNGLYFEDNPFHCEVLLTAKKIKLVRKYYYYRRRREGSITADSDEKYFDTIKISNLLIKSFEKQGKYEKYKELILNRKITYLLDSYNEIYDKFKNEYIELLNNDFNQMKKNKELNADLLSKLKGINKFVYINLNRNMDFTEFNFLLNKFKSNDIPNEEFPFINDINVALIMDPLSYNSYSPEFNDFPLNPKNWMETFENNDIDLFFCESTWHGVCDCNIENGIALEDKCSPWKDKIIYHFNDKENTLVNILEYCNKNNIPTIFWNKENPFAFNEFIDAALKFDYIFTTDEDSIIKYNARGHNNVYQLLFASQIKLYNPIENCERSNDVIFAGSWYSNMKDRCETMETFFDKLLDSGFNLKIYNRHYNLAMENEYWKFPEKYDKYIRPSVSSDEMANVYKESKFSLNINTITASPTMFARRVFELMSSNTLILSNFSKGVYNLFKDNVIYLENINTLSLDHEKVDEICERNLYNILENHTYYNRFKYILDTINLKYKERVERVFVIYIITKHSNIQNIIDNFNQINYFNKYCVLVTDDGYPLNDYKNKNTIFISYSELIRFKELLTNDDYFIFRFNNKQNEDFVRKTILHFKYIDKNAGIVSAIEDKYTFYSTLDYKDIVFNSINFEKVLNNISNIKHEKLIIYKI